MHGHHWVQAEATIAVALDMTPQPGERGFSVVYDVDVQMPDGDVQEMQIPSEHRALRPGMVVRVEVNTESGEARLHHNFRHLIISEDGPIPARGVEAAGSVPSPYGGGPMAGGVDFAEIFGGSLPGGAQISVAGGNQAAAILQQLAAGGEDRAALKDQLRHMLADLEGGAGPADAGPNADGSGIAWTQGP
jgi:hypothetical protein